MKISKKKIEILEKRLKISKKFQKISENWKKVENFEKNFQKNIFSFILSVHVYGHFLGLLWRSPLQNRSWSKLEGSGDLDFATLSWCCLWHLLFVEFFHLGTKIIRRGSIYDHDCNFVHVDGCFTAARYYRLLLWI